jgi:chitodextrinase
MKKIKLLKKFILLIVLTLFYINVNAQCSYEDDFSSFHAFTEETNYASPYYQTSPAGWEAEDGCRHTAGSDELYLEGGPIEDYQCGFVRSPIFPDGCSKISFFYKPYRGNVKFQVTIKQGTSDIWNDIVETVNPQVWQEYTAIVNITGNFQLVIKNISNGGNQIPGWDTYIKGICLTANPPDVTPPTAPTDLVSKAAYSSINLTWTASTDDVEVAGYNIYLNGDLIDTVTETTYTITGLTPEIEYTVAVEAFDAAGNKSEKASSTVTTPAVSYYASRVIEFLPAPGQFTNESLAKSTSAESILNNNPTGGISLGGFGGYVILGFEQPIVNHPQNPYGVDFSIAGNSFAGDLYGTWTEPGAVRVMKDLNGNGIPDDGEWYELAGSDYYLSSTQKNVEMTYYNPHYNERYTVPWRTNYGENGALLSNRYHSHSYYPDPFDFGCDRDSLTYTGNVIKSSLDMSTQNYVNFYRAPIFGYCDNRGYAADLTNPRNPYFSDAKGAATDGFDLSWAVDSEGNRVELDQVDFVKIYTAGNANAGWLGEWSTEVMGIAITKPDPTYVPQDYYLNYLGITQLKVLKGATCQFEGFLFKNGIPQEEGTQVWSTSKPEVGAVDATGLFTAVDNGETWLRFSQKGDIPTDSIRLLVVELTEVVLEMEGNSAISSDSTSLIAGETVSIIAQGLDNVTAMLNGSKSNRFVYDTYIWTTSHPEVGTINNGLFTGAQPGRTTVYAQSVGNPALKDSILVIVNPVPEVQVVARPVYIPYYAPEGTKQSTELLATGINSTVYLNAVTSRNGRITPVIEKNALRYSITSGNYGTDTLTFNITSFGVEQDIDVAFVYDADAYTTPKQLLYVDKTGSDENLKAYLPETGVTRKLIDAASPAIHDVRIDGAFAFVAAEGYVSRYSITTYAQTHQTEIAGNSADRLAVYKNLLLAAAHNASETYIDVYYKTDLTPVKQIALSGTVSDMALVGGKLYVLTTAEQSSKMAIIDLATLALEKEKSLYAEGVGVTNLVVRGTNIYGLRRHTGSAPAAVFRFDTSGETYSSVTVGGIEPYFENRQSIIEPATGDSLFLFQSNGFTAYSTATNELKSGIVMSKNGLYPTAAVYDPDARNYYAIYSDAAGQNAAGQVFDAQFAATGNITGLEDAPHTLRFSAALTDNEAPQASTAEWPNPTLYEKAASITNITIGKDLFTDAENDFAIYVRDLSAYSSWLNIDPSYSTNGGVRLRAKYSEAIDRDSTVNITIEAIDGYGLSLTRTLTITIKPRIYPPLVANPLPDVEVDANSADIEISLADVFAHTASGGVTFGNAVSGNTNAELLSATIAGDVLTLSLTPDRAGEAIITLRDSAVHDTYGVKYVETSFKVTVRDNVAPTAPTGLSATPAETSIALAWTASTDNVAIAGYTVYLNGDSIDTVTETAYTVTGLTAKTEYSVAVEAFDASGNRSAQVSQTVTTTFGTGGIDFLDAAVKVWYADGVLHLQQLEGCRILIYNIQGQPVAEFDVISSDETRRQSLAKGIYILFVEKGSKRGTIRFVVF